MALKALLLKKELDGKRSALLKADRKAEFETRTAELEKAINEITEDNTPEERDALTASIEELEAEKTANEEAIAKLREEIDAIEAELADLEKEQEVPAKPEERTKDMSEIMTRNSVEYIDAFAEYVKGNKDARELRNMLTTENASNGTETVAVPEIVYDTIKTAWDKEGIMSRVKKAYLRGNLKVGFEISGTDAVVHAEGAAAVSVEDLVLGIVELVPASIKKVVQVSDEALDLAGEAFLRYLYEELTYRIAKKAADELVAKIKACPVTATTTCPAVGQLQDNPAIDTIAQAIAKLSDQAENPVVIMNKATWGAFKSAQYAASYPVDPFEGLPVVFNNSLTAFSAATTGVTYAIVGDLGEGALANFPAGSDIDIRVDRLSLKKQDLVEVLGREYVGLGVVAQNAFVQIKKEA